MRARYYDPLLGRFISEDPARDGGNWYAYAGNNPVGMVDVDGKYSVADDVKDRIVGQMVTWLTVASMYLWNKGANQIAEGASDMADGRFMQFLGANQGGLPAPIVAYLAEMSLDVAGKAREASGSISLKQGFRNKVYGGLFFFEAQLLTSLGGDAIDYWADFFLESK